MSDSNDFLGKAVLDGVIRYLSVSALERADPRSMGCFRKWFYRYVLGIKDDQNPDHEKKKQLGIDLHGRNAHYLRTGEMVLQTLELKGKWMLPAPGPDLWIEQKFHRAPRPPLIDAGQIFSSLYAAGIPVVGFIDCAHGRRETVDEDGSRIVDPPGTIEVIDWKRKGNAYDREKNPLWKPASSLVHTIQMAGYGQLVANTQKHASYVRLSHGNFFERGSEPRKVTKLHVLDDCARTWEYVDGVARTLVDVAKETDVNRVPGNTRACNDFGGCPHLGYCTAYQRSSLDALYGKVASDLKEDLEMGLLTNNGILPQQPAAAAPQAPDMRAQLAAEEAQLRAQQAQSPANPMQDLANACARISREGKGFPTLGGNAAQAYAALGGQAIAPGSIYPGSLQFGSIRIDEPAHLLQLARELDGAQVQAPAPAPQPVVQQPAPVNYAALAALPTQAPPPGGQYVQPVQYNPATQSMQPVAGGILPPGAPQSIPQLAMTQPEPQVPVDPNQQAVQGSLAQPQPEAAAPARGRGRPKKNQNASGAAPEPTAAAPQAPTPSSPVSAPTQVAPAAVPTLPTVDDNRPGERTIILINARLDGTPSKSLANYVDYINVELSKRYCVDAQGKPTVQDVRCAPKESPLAYGGWKGAVREIVKQGVGLDGLEGAALHLDTFMDELNEAVADALRVVADQRGWLYVRAVRG